MIALLCTVIGMISISSTAFAATPNYYFSVTNTGQTFAYNEYGNSNQKVYTNEPWSFRVKGIEFTGGVSGYGMAYRLRNVNTALVSSIRWANVTGNYTGGWANGGPTGYYNMQGRMDDDLSGACISHGYWNADTIYNWPN